MTDAGRDQALAAAAVREWLGPVHAELHPLDAMNSTTWRVESDQGTFVLKVSQPSAEAGLHVASWLAEHGIETGAPREMAVREGRLIALLEYVSGTPLTEIDRSAAGEALGRVHALLREAPVPAGMTRWPWRWLDPSVIDDGTLRWAAESAIARAESLAADVTHGPLHGDPAPEAFLRDGDRIGLIDWGAACHGPFLYDVASAVMYSGDGVVDAYARTGPLGPHELKLVPEFLAFRLALQAWYFSMRLRAGDLTGIRDRADNEKGLNDARRGLLDEGASSA